MDHGDGCGWYAIGYSITAFIIFIACWIYAIAAYGWFLGIAFGWIPSLIIAAIVGALWPLLALAIVAILVFLLWLSKA